MADELFERLYQDIKHGRLAAVEEYLDQDGDQNLTNRNSWSLLMAAAFKGNSRILSLLLERKATLEATNSAGETALTLAAGGGYIKCVRLLLANGADVGVRPLGQYLSAFIRCARQPSEEVNQLLAEAGADCVLTPP